MRFMACLAASHSLLRPLALQSLHLFARFLAICVWPPSLLHLTGLQLVLRGMSEALIDKRVAPALITLCSGPELWVNRSSETFLKAKYPVSSPHSLGWMFLIICLLFSWGGVGLHICCLFCFGFHTGNDHVTLIILLTTFFIHVIGMSWFCCVLIFGHFNEKCMWMSVV